MLSIVLFATIVLFTAKKKKYFQLNRDMPKVKICIPISKIIKCVKKGSF